MTDYSFVTRWQIAAPLERVWDVIVDSPNWPQWWRAVARVQMLSEGDPPMFLGRDLRLTWRTQLPYGFTFDIKLTRIEPLHIIEGQARGELEGTGLWTFTRDGAGTLLQYDWTVRTNVPWMNTFAPLLKPAFVYNHNVVMRWGKEGLAKRLGVRVSDVSPH
ncbi:MAG: SRPBCC family protein [Chloroflexi bacterium]|nr:SRPBCC family protein [Chloroflexota bacterium]